MSDLLSVAVFVIRDRYVRENNNNNNNNKADLCLNLYPCVIIKYDLSLSSERKPRLVSFLVRVRCYCTSKQNQIHVRYF